MVQQMKEEQERNGKEINCKDETDGVPTSRSGDKEAQGEAE